MGISQHAGSSSGFNNVTLEKVLKKANLLTATDLQFPEQISNETLWNIFTLYQIEKGHKKEQDDIDKRKNAFNTYHKELKDQLQENQGHRDHLQELRICEIANER